MNEHDLIIESLSAVKSLEMERTNGICSAAWRKVRDAHPEVLARATADAWQLEAIHATRARPRCRQICHAHLVDQDRAGSEGRLMDTTKPESNVAAIPTPKPGQRVGAILEICADHVVLIGYGVLLEEEVPGPEAKGPITNVLRESGLTNPTILLDDGTKVWGCECWWAPEDRVREIIGKLPVVAAPRSEWPVL